MSNTYTIVDAFTVEATNKNKVIIALNHRIDYDDYDKKEVVIDGRPTTYELTHNENWIVIPKPDSDVLGKTATFK
jgi:hypothetical protein